MGDQSQRLKNFSEHTFTLLEVQPYSASRENNWFENEQELIEMIYERMSDLKEEGYTVGPASVVACQAQLMKEHSGQAGQIELSDMLNKDMRVKKSHSIVDGQSFVEKLDFRKASKAEIVDNFILGKLRQE